MNWPSEPSYTCPKIDKAKKETERLVDCAKDDLDRTLSHVHDHMEELRSSNEEIRAWANEIKKMAEAEIERLESEIADLNEQLNAMQAEAA